MKNILKLIVLVVCFLMLTKSVVVAQNSNEIVRMDTIVFDFPEEFPEDFDFKAEFFQYISSGWFPTPFPKQALLFGINDYSNVEEVRNIRSNGFKQTTSPLQGNILFRDRHRAFPDEYFETVESFSEVKTPDQVVPFASASEYSIDYLLQGYVPAFLQFKAGYRAVRSLLTSVDTTRSYLTISGNKKNFSEITTIDVFERRFFFAPKVVIPLYGLYMITEDQSLSSVYYIFGSYDMEYAYSIDVHQYVQLADVKQELRYENGTDIQTIERKSSISTLNKFRTTYQTGGGVDFSIDGFRVQFELFAGYPTRSILTDASWRQFPWGLRFLFGGEF